MNNENMTIHLKVKDFERLAYKLQWTREGTRVCRHY